MSIRAGVPHAIGHAAKSGWVCLRQASSYQTLTTLRHQSFRSFPGKPFQPCTKRSFYSTRHPSTGASTAPTKCHYRDYGQCQHTLASYPIAPLSGPLCLSSKSRPSRGHTLFEYFICSLTSATAVVQQWPTTHHTPHLRPAKMNHARYGQDQPLHSDTKSQLPFGGRQTEKEGAG